MQLKEIAKNSAIPVAKSAVVGLASNGFLTLVMNVADKLSNVPSVYIKENPDITIEEFLKKFSEFNKVLSNANLVATFGGFGGALFTFLFTYLLMNWIKTGHCLPTGSNPLIVDATTHEPINDSNVAPLPTRSSWKDKAKTAGLVLLMGAAIWGFLSLIRSSAWRNAADYVADEAPSVESLNDLWSLYLLTNIIIAGAAMGLAVTGSTAVIVARRCNSSFWRHSDNANLTEESRLVALPVQEADKLTESPTLNS